MTNEIDDTIDAFRGRRARAAAEILAQFKQSPSGPERAAILTVVARGSFRSDAEYAASCGVTLPTFRKTAASLIERRWLKRDERAGTGLSPGPALTDMQNWPREKDQQ